MKTILSIGYARYSLEEFVATLLENGVQHLIDTRERPLSRKKGFSKTKLSIALAKADINYTHFRSLGSPSASREILRQDGDYGRFFSSVRTQLQSSDAMEALEFIAKTAKRQTVCLMCICEDVSKCHRSQVLSSLPKLHALEIGKSNLAKVG